MNIKSRAIVIKPSKTADSRTCDFTKVTKEELLESSKQHISDIKRGFEFLIEMMKNQADNHDLSKITHINDFHRNFATGFKEKDWWEYHQEVERHHFIEEKYIPSDVNLIDILDQIVDGVMAGMARSGKYRQEPISPELLTRAYLNTVHLLLNNVEVDTLDGIPSATSWRDQHQQPPIALNREWYPCPLTRMAENWGSGHDPECHACGGSGRIGGPITCSNMQICHDEGFTRCQDCPVTR